MTGASARRAAVLGHPIAHSLSPVLHRAAYAQLGLDWTYDTRDVEASELGQFLDRCGPEWAGLSLTMPLKRAVLPLLDSASALVGIVGAANTVVLGTGGRVGHNTDVTGIVEALRAVGAEPGPAVVLGAGATAASAVAAVAELGCPQVQVHARRPDAAEELRPVAERVGIPLRISGWPDRLPDLDRATMVVSTLPADAGGRLVDCVPSRPGALLDVSYAPWPPPLVNAWRAAGGRAVAGDEMLLHQAVEQVLLMCGRRPEVAPMRAALRVELDRRTQAQAALPE